MTLDGWMARRRPITVHQRAFLALLAHGPRLVSGQPLRLAQHMEAMGLCTLGPIKRVARGHRALARITPEGRRRVE
jgi:hypothetical protein